MKKPVKFDEFPSLDIEGRLDFTINSMPETVILTTSFGIESAIMLDLCSKYCPDILVILIDTGQLFQETYQYADTLMRLYGSLRYCVYSPEMTISRMVSLHGNLWENGKTGRYLWLERTKMQPMRNAIRERSVSTWISGVRKDHNENRQNKDFIEWSEKWGLWRVHPILDWTDEMVEDYFVTNELLRHPLWERYERVGDYWDSTKKHLECGLHIEVDYVI